jgi:hypothetical protein
VSALFTRAGQDRSGGAIRQGRRVADRRARGRDCGVAPDRPHRRNASLAPSQRGARIPSNDLRVASEEGKAKGRGGGNYP